MPDVLRVRNDPALMLHLHRLFAAIALGAAALFFALLTLRDEVHLLPVGLGDTLGYHAFIESAQQLLDGLPIASFDFHPIA